MYQVLLSHDAQDPRHLQYVADVNESNAYVVTQGRKLYGMPTDFGFCVKVRALAWPGPVWGKDPRTVQMRRQNRPGSSRWDSPWVLRCPRGSWAQDQTGDRPLPLPQPNKLRNGHKGLHIFCSEDEQSRTCWLTAFRLFKVRPEQWGVG